MSPRTPSPCAIAYMEQAYAHQRATAVSAGENSVAQHTCPRDPTEHPLLEEFRAGKISQAHALAALGKDRHRPRPAQVNTAPYGRVSLRSSSVPEKRPCRSLRSPLKFSSKAIVCLSARTTPAHARRCRKIQESRSPRNRPLCGDRKEKIQTPTRWYHRHPLRRDQRSTGSRGSRGHCRDDG